MSTCLTGKWDLSLDERGRVAFPTRCRNKLAELYGTTQREAYPNLSEGRLWVTVGRAKDEMPLFIYPDLKWRPIEAELPRCDATKPNVLNAQWRVIGHAEAVELDRSGRLLISQTLREDAQLEKRVVLMGVVNRFELWDYALYKQRLAGDPPQLDLDGLGSVPF